MTLARTSLVLCLSAFTIALLSGCFPNTCGNQVLEEAPSPEARYKAVAFERDCGATTGFSTQVSVLPADEGDPEGAGNVFVANIGHGATSSGPGGGLEVSLEWAADETLVITYDSQARVSKTESHLEGVDIEYRAVNGEETASSS